MEELKERLESCQRALTTLEEILVMEFSVIVRDASIQRFEYSFESLWKLLKAHLYQYEGIVCNSPKQCFREGFKVGLLSVEEAEICLVMTDDRNLTSHTYHETIADAIYGKLPAHLAVMKSLLKDIRERVTEEQGVWTSKSKST
jgi:nucleotidyltransferase substrate binding protein (TIGR01987 family)